MHTKALARGWAVLLLVLGSCVPTTTPPLSKTITIGYTMSQTGSLGAESKEQVQGLQLWADEVNSHGGFQVGSSVVQVQFKFYDDASDKDQVTALYTKLVSEDKVDFLVSPYSSGLATAAAVVAEQQGKILIAVGAAADSLFNRGFRHVFQLYTPASRYLTGALDMLRGADSRASRVAIVYEDESFATSVANAARQYAEQQRVTVVLFEKYPPGTTDFTTIIDRLLPLEPDAILGGGHAVDGDALARQLYERRVSTKMVALLVAPAVPAFSQLGEAAMYVIGPSQWEPQSQYGAAGAKSIGVPFYGLEVSGFVKLYTDKYGYGPGYHASGGYAAGLVLQRAMEDAGSTDPALVLTALGRVDIMTCYGRVKFDMGPQFGLQIGHEMVYLQWQKDSAGQLTKQVVWPAAGRSAPLLYPRRVP